jgi:hypothetical protein
MARHKTQPVSIATPDAVAPAPAADLDRQEMLLTREEVATRLNVRPETLSRWAAIGRGPRPTVKDGRMVRWSRASIAEYYADPTARWNPASIPGAPKAVVAPRPPTCSCRSGLPRRAQHGDSGIFEKWTCDKCSDDRPY